MKRAKTPPRLRDTTPIQNKADYYHREQLRQEIDGAVNRRVMHCIEMMKWAGYPTEQELQDGRDYVTGEADAWREHAIAELNAGSVASVAADIASLDATIARNRMKLHEQFGPYNRNQK